MKKLVAVGALWLGACSPSIPHNAAPNTITADFDLTAVPAVAPSPNDLAKGPDGGNLQVPLNQQDSAVDNEVFSYLDTLTAFPPDSTATAKLSGPLATSSVNANSVIAYDLTANAAIPVQPAYQDNTDSQGNITGEIAINPPAGVWPPGHTIAIALLGEGGGLVGRNQQEVVGSASWQLVSSTNPLVSCNADGSNCQPTTGLIATPAQAEALEPIRLATQAMLQTLASNDGVNTADVVLAWQFTTLSNPILLFSPATQQVPTPNDLAIVNGTVSAPVDPTSSLAQQEWTQNYLNTLNGFPVLSPGDQQVIDGDLDPASVTPATVQVVDLTATAATGMPVVPAATVAYDSVNHQIVVSPPAAAAATATTPATNAGWTKGHQYAVLVLAGATGVTGPGGEPVIPSSPEILVTGPNPLVNCPTPALDPTTCTPAFDLAPLSAAQAVQLEQIRQGYTAILSKLAPGAPAGSIGGFWTFTILSSPEIVFNLQASNGDLAMPFPNFALFNPATGKVNFPIADGGSAAQTALLEGLNTLDGFGTSSVILAKYDFTSSETPDLDIPGATLIASSLAVPGAKCSAPSCTMQSDGDGGTILLNQAVGLVALSPDAGQPLYQACLNCTSLGGPDGGEAEQLQIVPALPLAERSDYVGYVSTSVLANSPLAPAADGGAPGVPLAPSFLFSFLRLSNPLVDANGHSTMPAELADGDAAQLEPLRQAMAQSIAPLEASGLPESSIALAWGFHTQSEQSQLDSLAQFAASVPLQANGSKPVPSTPFFAFDVSSVILSTTNIAANPFLAPIGKVYEVSYPSALLLDLNTGAFHTDPTAATLIKIGAFLSLPKTPANGGPPVPANGYPVLIFGHGVTRSSFDALAIMGAASEAGYAIIAPDTVWHGERATCAGVAAGTQGLFGASDNDACVTPPYSDGGFGVGFCDEGVNPDGGIGGIASPTYGRCVSLPGVTPLSCNPNSAGLPGDLLCFNVGQGVCVTDPTNPQGGHCEGGDLKRTGGTGSDPVISGWNMLNVANFFATRDNFRQQMVDLGQLIRVLKDPALNTALSKTATTLDTTNISYTGMSLGGILGTLFVSASPDIQRVVLDVPGGGLSHILLTSPAFQPLASGLEAGLAAQGITVGSLGFDYFINTAQWVVDPADPINAAPFAANQSYQPADRSILVQYIQNDQVVPNPASLALLASANRSGPNSVMSSDFYTPPGLDPNEPQCPAGDTGSSNTCTVASCSCLADADRHGFIIDWADPVVTQDAQTQLMGYIATGKFTQQSQ